MTRRDFIYSTLETALNNLTGITVVDTMVKEYPYAMLFLGDDTINPEHAEGQERFFDEGDTNFDIYVNFKITTKKDSEAEIRTEINKWVEDVEKVIKAITLSKKYTFTTYKLTLATINIRNIITLYADEKEKIGSLLMHGVVNYHKSYT